MEVNSNSGDIEFALREGRKEARRLLILIRGPNQHSFKASGYIFL